VRSFLIAAVQLDQIAYGALGDQYNRFRERFRLPKLGGHGLGGYASAGWLVRNGYGDKDEDRRNLEYVARLLAAGTTTWVRSNLGPESAQRYRKKMTGWGLPEELGAILRDAFAMSDPELVI